MYAVQRFSDLGKGWSPRRRLIIADNNNNSSSNNSNSNSDNSDKWKYVQKEEHDGVKVQIELIDEAVDVEDGDGLMLEEERKKRKKRKERKEREKRRETSSSSHTQASGETEGSINARSYVHTSGNSIADDVELTDSYRALLCPRCCVYDCSRHGCPEGLGWEVSGVE